MLLAPATGHTQMKELEDLFQAQPAERPRQTRFTRAQQRAMNAGQVVAGTLTACPAAAAVCVKRSPHWLFFCLFRVPALSQAVSATRARRVGRRPMRPMPRPSLTRWP